VGRWPWGHAALEVGPKIVPLDLHLARLHLRLDLLLAQIVNVLHAPVMTEDDGIWLTPSRLKLIAPTSTRVP